MGKEKVEKKDKKIKDTKKTNKDTIVIEKKKLKKIVFILIPILLLIAIILPIFINIANKGQQGKLYSIKNENHFNRIIKTKVRNNRKFAYLFASPILLLNEFTYYRDYHSKDFREGGPIMPGVPTVDSSGPTKENISGGPSSDYSKTNIQVENIDEADVVKTDGGYVYSISGNSVVITNVMDINNPKVMTKITSGESTTPTDILINKNKLLIISMKPINSPIDQEKTLIEVYDISNKEKPSKDKSILINSEYNTSRMIDNKIYVFAKKTLYDKESIRYFREYTEDFKQKQIPFDNIKYLKSKKTNNTTTFVSLDLNTPSKDVSIKTYLVDLNTAYISHNNIYLLDTKYWDYENNNPIWPEIKKILGFKGIFGLIDVDNTSTNFRRDYKNTTISKYAFTKDGDIEFKEITKIKGNILNQYSCDEKDGNLRIAVNDYQGTRIVVLDKDLKEIGNTGSVAKGEDNKSVRFIGDRAYFVTYKKVDPLYAIDLSNPRDPKIMGELKIPGFSNYLHPYDENHIVGIGMATEEDIIKDEFGKPIRENITFNGMKMTMFDISNIKNPVEKNVVYFGDSLTDSQINKNPKALLFSKEKNLIAIPINNMGQTNFWSPNSNNKKIDKNLSKIVVNEKVKEGYIVYNITEDGFKYKGIITHDSNTTENKSDSNKDIYPRVAKRNPLRGLYIDSNLITVSEEVLKINELNTLRFISNIDLIKETINKTEIGKTYTKK